MKKYLLMALFFLCGIAVTSTADAATITVCASGCNETSVSMALDTAMEGDTVQVQGGGASPYSSVGETFGTVFPAASITLQCTDGATISQTDPTGPNTFVLTTSSTVTGCTFGNVSLTTASSAYTSGIVITGNTFTQGTTGTIDFVDGHVAHAEITNNSNIRWLRSTASSTNMLISGNTFYGDEPIDTSVTTGMSLALTGTSTSPIIRENTFSLSFQDTLTVDSDALYIKGSDVTFATNTIRMTATMPDNLRATLRFRMTDGFFYVSGNKIETPYRSSSGGSCYAMSFAPGVEVSMSPDIRLTNNTIRGRCGNAVNGIEFDSTGIGSETMLGTVVLTRNLLAADESAAIGVSYASVSAPSDLTVTHTDNGFYQFGTAVGAGSLSVTEIRQRTNNPFLRLGNVSTSDDLDVAPFSDYLDIEYTTNDIGATSAARRSTIAIDDDGTVDYDAVDATSAATIFSQAVRSGDTVNLAAGTYGGFTVGSARATSSVSVVGAGASTIVNAATNANAVTLSGVTEVSISGITAQNASSTYREFSTTKMLFSYGGADYDTGNALLMIGPLDMGVLNSASTCSFTSVSGDGWTLPSLGDPPLAVHVALTSEGPLEKATLLVPATYAVDQAAFSALCPTLTVDAFIEDVFTFSSGAYSYFSSVIDSAGAALLGGLSSPAITLDSTTYYAGIRFEKTVTTSTVTSVTFTANSYGALFSGDGTTEAHGNTIRNGTFTSNTQYDVRTDSSGQNILSNSSFDRTSVRVDGALGSMLVKYDARVRTLKGSDGSTAVDGVTTSFTDGLSTATSGGVTSSGYTSYVTLPAHTITNASNALTTGGYNPYTVATTALSGYAASSTSATLSTPNQTVTIYLTNDTNAPGAPTITALSGTTASIGVDENSNGGTVEYTLYNSTSASYVAADGSASATAAWQTAANWEAATISGLTCNTAYSFVMNARNALGDVTATSSAGVVTTSACSSGGGATSAGPGAFYVPLPVGVTPPVSTEPVLPPVVAPAPETPSTPAPITEAPTAPSAPASNQARTQISSDATSFRVTLAPQDQERLASFIDAGTTPATQALGSGERRALVRDALDTMGRAPTQADLERLAQGQIPQTRNLAREREQLPRARSTFRTIYGRDPNFQNAQENLAWNTLMYRIRFTRDLTEERQGITAFRQTFRRAPSDPFQWAVVRVLGYVR